MRTEALPDETPSLIEGIPLPILEGLRHYAIHHVPVGDFLTAVLSNKLVESFGRADEHSTRAMWSIVNYCYNVLPSPCWGSPEKVKAWLECRRVVDEEDAEFCQKQPF
jgi:hypothetical protein